MKLIVFAVSEAVCNVFVIGAAIAEAIFRVVESRD